VLVKDIYAMHILASEAYLSKSQFSLGNDILLNKS
jgi:hypothetical protein